MRGEDLETTERSGTEKWAGGEWVPGGEFEI